MEQIRTRGYAVIDQPHDTPSFGAQFSKAIGPGNYRSFYRGSKRVILSGNFIDWLIDDGPRELRTELMEAMAAAVAIDDNWQPHD
jgi:hypothetical protein